MVLFSSDFYRRGGASAVRCLLSSLEVLCERISYTLAALSSSVMELADEYSEQLMLVMLAAPCSSFADVVLMV
jgi:hypothetical protein